MAIERIDWKDEQLAPMMIDGQEDYAPRYDIVDATGAVVSKAARLNLLNRVLVEGTRHNAQNMSKLMQKADAVGSFNYRPMGRAVLHDFSHAVPVSSWARLPDCPVDLGENPVCVEYGGRWFVTLGRLAQYNGLTYDIAVYDPAAAAWDIMRQDRAPRPVNLGGVQDARVVGTRLVVAAKDWDKVNNATAWVDTLDLENLTWQPGPTARWPGEVRTIGPVAVDPCGTRAIAMGRDGAGSMGNWVDRFDGNASSLMPSGMLPMIDGQVMIPEHCIVFGTDYIACFASGVVQRTANLFAWAQVAMPGGNFVPIGADENHAVFMANHAIIRMDRNNGISEFAAGGVINPQMAVRAQDSGLYYYAQAGQNAGWARFDSATGNVETLPDAPVKLANDYGLAAAGGLVFAAKGCVAYLGRFGEISRGVVIGRVFKGLSVSATGDVYLVNDKRTVVVQPGGWHAADDDYLICAAPEAAVFGQIVNI